MNRSNVKLTGINPKCLNGMSSFVGADGKYYPCCFMYTSEQLAGWAKKHQQNIEDIDIRKNGFTAVYNSEFYKKFYNSFDCEVCHRECGDTSYDTEQSGKPKWTKYERK